ncbi:hemagglutinin/amebocyte aggregation factor [Elysia marginata]|uniref:Hemagglutinin/amebocyte aggregation factor n=1 Tax=Elysia marginata TaxID=1093978 RepID=A0AAV4GWK1_9GAST|nr:hemagglutinin/amebocyte aggregation factor [Elysia marginata]
MHPFTPSDFANDYDELLEFQCPNEGIITGMESTHSNRREDRIFKFKCCQPLAAFPPSQPSTPFVITIKLTTTSLTRPTSSTTTTTKSSAKTPTTPALS